MKGRNLIALGGLFLACSGSSEADPPFWRPSYDSTDGAASSGDPAPAGDDDDSTTPPSGGDLPDAGSNSNSGGPGTVTITDSGIGGGNVSPDSGGGATGSPPPCSLAVTVTTATVGGKYAPNNILAIWVADGSNAFVKTLSLLANRRVEHLQQFGAVTTAAGHPDDTVDAITGATQLTHGTRKATWNCTDHAKKLVAAGAYRVCFELTEGNSAGPVDCVPFTLGPNAATLTPSDTTAYKKRTIVFTP